MLIVVDVWIVSWWCEGTSSPISGTMCVKYKKKLTVVLGLKSRAITDWPTIRDMRLVLKKIDFLKKDLGKKVNVKKKDCVRKHKLTRVNLINPQSG